MSSTELLAQPSTYIQSPTSSLRRPPPGSSYYAEDRTICSCLLLDIGVRVQQILYTVGLSFTAQMIFKHRLTVQWALPFCNNG